MGSGATKQKVNRATQVTAGSRDSSTPTNTYVPSFSKKKIPSTQGFKPADGIASEKQTKNHPIEKPSSFSHYEHIWHEDGKLSQEFQQLQAASTLKIEHHQQEVRKETMESTHTATCESAKVESTLAAQVETVHQLQTSEKLDHIIEKFKETNVVFDSELKKRLDLITSESELILAKIIEETGKSQQALLVQAKQQQMIEDEEYRKELAAFVTKLDEKRAKHLAFIHKQCQEQRLAILIESQTKIRQLHEQSNMRKYQIMSEEESKTSKHVEQLVQEMEAMSIESASQQLGTEIKTNIHLTVHESIGTATVTLEKFNQQSNGASNAVVPQK